MERAACLSGLKVTSLPHLISLDWKKEAAGEGQEIVQSLECGLKITLSFSSAAAF